MSIEDIHDLHDFLKSAQQMLEAEYQRIQKHVREDPGTAGDQGEENWRALFEEWLPPYFRVVTKGRILTHDNFRSPQIDVLILKPSYPPFLADKKLYLAAGVAAAFECKLTLTAKHIETAVKTCAKLKRALPRNRSTVRDELCAPIMYGLLAHSHSWKAPASTPAQNITKKLKESDLQYVLHPREILDLICVAELGVWRGFKGSYIGPRMTPFPESMKATYGNGKATSGHYSGLIDSEHQREYFSPIGATLTKIFQHLAWEHLDMRDLMTYFNQVGVGGTGSGDMRLWDLSIYDSKVRQRIEAIGVENGVQFSYWGIQY